MNYDPSNPDPRVIYLSHDADDSEDRTWGESPESVGGSLCPSGPTRRKAVARFRDDWYLQCYNAFSATAKE